MIDPETGRFIAAAEMMPDNFAFNAAKHFLKAVRKHPRFADALHGYRDSEMVKTYLEECREILVSKRQNSKVYATDLLECEILEAWCAPNDQETISELYDAVAVLMRMIAVVEGKQKLGGAK
jgi:hypothetical protein